MCAPLLSSNMALVDNHNSLPRQNSDQMVMCGYHKKPVTTVSYCFRASVTQKHIKDGLSENKDPNSTESQLAELQRNGCQFTSVEGWYERKSKTAAMRIGNSKNEGQRSTTLTVFLPSSRTPSSTLPSITQEPHPYKEVCTASVVTQKSQHRAAHCIEWGV